MVSRVYKKAICRLAEIPLDQFDHWYRRAFTRLNCEPTDVALIAKVMKHMAKRAKLKTMRKSAE